MQFFRYRENHVHGDDALPLQAYNLPSRGNFVFPCHWHPEFEFLLVNDGRLLLQRGQRTITVQAGEAAFLGPAELHTGLTDGSGCRCQAVVFSGTFLESSAADGGQTRWLQPLMTGELALPDRIGPAAPFGQRMVDCLAELAEMAERREPGDELLIKGNLLQIIGLLARAGLLTRGASPPGPAIRDSERLKKVLAHIEQRLSRQHSLEELATVACLSKSAFSRFFKAHTGETPIEYINRSRVARAAGLLAASDCTVTDAAAAVGFENLSYFTRTFKRYRGVCPSDIAPA